MQIMKNSISEIANQRAARRRIPFSEAAFVEKIVQPSRGRGSPGHHVASSGTFTKGICSESSTSRLQTTERFLDKISARLD